MKILPRIGAQSLALLLALSALPALYAKTSVLFHEDFATLDNWKPFTFPKIKKHSTYAVEQKDGRQVLRTESRASASAIVYRESFNVYEYPVVRWRWKVESVYEKADATTKEGDDYPIRVYVMFEYDPDKAGVAMKLKYGLAKKLYGVYPPHSSLNYVWASRKGPQRVLTSPYTDRAKMILLRQGAEDAGAWLDEEIDILADYQKAFGAKPPERARIAVMNDSDNTGESSVSYMDYIEVVARGD
jgi:hypothetical protein